MDVVLFLLGLAILICLIMYPRITLGITTLLIVILDIIGFLITDFSDFQLIDIIPIIYLTLPANYLLLQNKVIKMKPKDYKIIPTLLMFNLLLYGIVSFYVQFWTDEISHSLYKNNFNNDTISLVNFLFFIYSFLIILIAARDVFKFITLIINNFNEEQNNKYFYAAESKQYGPYTISELKRRKITKGTLVWKEPMAEWEKIENIPELNDVISINTPPPLPQKPVLRTPIN